MKRHASVFTDDQIKELKAPLNPALIKKRKGGTGTVQFMQGHTVFDQANRIYGHGNWQTRVLSENTRVIYDPLTSEAVGVMCEATVELEIAGMAGTIIEIGRQPVALWNVKQVIDGRRREWTEKKKAEPYSEQEIHSARSTIMDSYEAAAKGAATDGEKRCHRLAGNQFANSLYGDGLVAIENVSDREEEGEVIASDLQQNSQVAAKQSAPQKAVTTISLTKEQRAAYADERLLFSSRVSGEDYDGFCTMADVPIDAQWTDAQYTKAHEVLAQYGAPDSMKELFRSYDEKLTLPAMQRFTKRILGKALGEASALPVARSIGMLDEAYFLVKLAKHYDPEFAEVKQIGVKNPGTSIDHPLDLIGRDKLLGDYKVFLKNQVTRNPDLLKDFPTDLKERHIDAWKKLNPVKVKAS